MKTIWKFWPGERSSLSMPRGAKVLTAREQGDGVCIWVEVDPDQPREERRFAVYRTGHKLPAEPGAYIGTAMLAGGLLVLHVYEEPTPYRPQEQSDG